ncbi:SNF2 family N-terminal domain-containing protein [Suillus subalutaceus]|uniref:SNF2 family N-terminal domain-containing protein n=1 Tax=Suillus subalutaceus TaxID=48586 RepID=UPI001B8824A9|nr:SNF2 family N-terminal domain-containing protein [Suillus subalutaceus]KAG1854196.1 SNF2 family N-terminal domain-containing protein [Suillus subalutaceus]
MPTKHSKWSGTSKKSEKGVKSGLRNGKREGRGRRNGVTKGAQLVSQEDVAVERTTMLLERQAELDQIMDAHDTMVREVFHLEKFVTLIEYDPSYKSDYDLLEKASTSAGPSRATRRAHIERVQNLTAPLLPSTASRVHTEPELPLSAKSKGKQKAVDSVNGTAPIESVTPNKPGKSKPISQPPKLRALAPILPVDGEASVSMGPVRGKKRNITAASPTGSPARKFQDGLASEVAEIPNVLGYKSTGPDDVALDLSQISARRKSLRHPPAMIREPPTLFQLPSEVEPPQSQFNIRRVKLIVRPPPPLYSNPRQQPPRPRFHSSLSGFLNSYVSINDSDLREDDLNLMVQKKVALLDKMESFRQQGRLIMSKTRGGVGFHEPKQCRDTWDVILEAITQRSRREQVKGRVIAAQISTRIKAQKCTEERRLRALAKATVKVVTSEWKKAVFHIREQHRLRAEAEERRRGHEHLDAILDRSGHILETQQAELARGDMSRSRSSSVSGHFLEPGFDSEGSENSESEVDEGDVDGVEQQFSSQASDRDTENAEEEEEEESTKYEEEEDEEDGTSASALLGPSLPRFEVDDTSSATSQAGANLLDAEMNDEEESEAILSVVAMESPSPIPFSLPMSRETPTDSDSVLHEHTTEDYRSPHFESFNDAPSPASTVAGHEEEPISNFDGSKGMKMTVTESTSDTLASGADDVDMGQATERFETPSSRPPSSTFGMEVDESELLDEAEDIHQQEDNIPDYLKPYAVAPVHWDTEYKVKVPVLLRGVLRPYQQSGLEWLASLHVNNLNGILADEMGLGKTIQTISLLAHLACDRGIWGPHLIIVPTSVLLNWEMEFKKFLPGFKTLSYHGSTKRRKELRQGWYNKHHFNVCITSYTLASRDAHIFKRKAWYYMILDEAHMIKNFKSQRWNILLMFRSFRRLLLTGTPLQNNLTELWALLQFLMSGTNFANLKEFGEWFSNPLEKAIEMGTLLDDENMQRVTKLHTVLRPYLLRRLKRDVEKELPSKYEHLVLCPLSKRQRFLYDEFMERAHTRDALQSGVYQKIANILMQLRKVCNHPDLFEVRPIVTSFAMTRSVAADFEIKELLVRRELLRASDEDSINLDVLGLRFIDQQNVPLLSALETRRLDATHRLPLISEMPEEPPPKDTRTIQGYRTYYAYQQRVAQIARWAQIGYLNSLRCAGLPVYSQELLTIAKQCHRPILPLSALDIGHRFMDTALPLHSAVKTYADRTKELQPVVERFAFVTPAAVALDLPRFALAGCEHVISRQSSDFDSVLHHASVKLQIAFPDPSLLQYDCGKLQELSRLLRQRKLEGHRVLIFTQMTRILDILEIFLNFHGYLYLRLDGATKIEDRQYITERFNADSRIFCFISSSRSGGVGINLTGADTVIFYDSDFNPQMDKQCEDRAHRIGQIRDVHIYRFISAHTVEEAMLLKANQKRSLDDLVIQKGEFDWRSLFDDQGALSKALVEFEDKEDVHAATVAAREEDVMEGADQADFGAEGEINAPLNDGRLTNNAEEGQPTGKEMLDVSEMDQVAEEEDEGGAVSDYMINFVRMDYDFFRDWRL